MRDLYNKKIEYLSENLLSMGNLIETAIRSCVKALKDKDIQLATTVMEQDCEIDAKEKEIAGICTSLVLLQQPVASDLRMVTAASKIITDMERIGDYATDISELVIVMKDVDYINYIDDILSMGTNAIEMLQDSINGYISQNMELVKKVRNQDDVVDNLFTKAKDDMSDLLKADIKEGKCAIDLIMISKYFERIADHSVNIAEWTDFCKTGYYKNTKII